MAEELARYRIAPLDGLPPFAGGAVGLFGYDLVRSAEPTVGEPNPDDVGVPDLALMVTDVLLAFDHLRHEVTVLANVLAEGDVERAYEDAAAAIADVRERLRGPVPQRAAAGGASRRSSRPTSAPTATPRRSSARRSTSAPATSTRWCRASAGAPDCPVDAFSIYRGLRAINPSPYMYFLDFEDFEIAGASPESLVTVDGPARCASARSPARARAPTRSRRTCSRRATLLADEKERAEHVMLVDLGRNDLGRVCEYGSRDRGRADGRRDLLARDAHRLARCRARCATA